MLSNFWHFYFLPQHQAWYHGTIWESVVALPICAVITVGAGWLWSKTRYWPLRPIREGIGLLHAKFDAHHEKMLAHQEHQTSLIEEMHYYIHTGKPHPRVENRISAKKPITPIKTPSLR